MKRVFFSVIVALLCLAVVAPATAEKEGRLRQVESGSQVVLKYTVVADDVVVESSDEGGPLVFTVGDGKVLPGLEREVVGMRIGEIKKFDLKPEDAYGLATELVRELPFSALPSGIKPEKQMVLVLDDAESGRKRFITIVEVKEKSVVVDFNHPLAGKQLSFEIEVLRID